MITLFVIMTLLWLGWQTPSRKLFARIKFSGLISEIRGKLDNVIIQGWKSGVFSVKNMMTSVRNPNSPAQDSRRATLSTASKDWADTLTSDQRAAWESYALQEPGKYPAVPGVRQIIPSNNGKMSGINAFVLTQGWLISAGLAGVTDPPLAATPPGKPEGVAVSSLAGTLTVTWTDPTQPAAGCICRVWIASASGKFHKQLVGAALSATATVDITLVRGAMGKTIALTQFADELVYVQCDIVDPLGGKSAGSNCVDIVVV